MSVFKNTKAAAVAEYGILLATIGGVVIFSTLQFSSEVVANFSASESTLEQSFEVASESVSSETQPAQSSGAIQSLDDLAANPYAPDRSTRDPSRHYEEFVVVRYLDGATHQHTFDFAASSNPAEIKAVSPNGLVSSPFNADSNLVSLCVEASSATGILLDPVRSMFPPVFGGSASDIQVHDVVTFERTSDETGISETQGYMDGVSVGVAAFSGWSGSGQSVNGLYGFTCSYPL